jgi:hypothetical protein
MFQMILSEPSIIIIWTYQDRMEWMSRILVGEMAGADEAFCLEDGQIRLICLFSLQPNSPVSLSMNFIDQYLLQAANLH